MVLQQCVVTVTELIVEHEKFQKQASFSPSPVERTVCRDSEKVTLLFILIVGGVVRKLI